MNTSRVICIYYVYPDINYSDLRADLDLGSRLPSPPCCPGDVFQIMSSCWEEDPYARPSFSQIIKRLYQTSILEDVVYNNKRRSQLNSGSEDMSSEEGATVYTHVLSNTSLYEKYREIQSTNSSYMKMNGQTMYISHNPGNENEQECENDSSKLQETDSLHQKDNHTTYCHYLTLKSQKSGSVSSIQDTDSGASTDHNQSAFTDTVISELTSNSHKENVKLGRLQSLNEVEEDNQC